jgi:hypothetical protein
VAYLGPLTSLLCTNPRSPRVGTLTSVPRVVLDGKIYISIASTHDRTPAVRCITCQNDIVALSILCPPPGTRTSLVASLVTVIMTGHVAQPVPNTSGCNMVACKKGLSLFSNVSSCYSYETRLYKPPQQTAKSRSLNRGKEFYCLMCVTTSCHFICWTKFL